MRYFCFLTNMPLALVLVFFLVAFNSSSSSSSSVCNYRHYLIWTFLNFAIGISFGDLGLENNSTRRSSSSSVASPLILPATTTATPDSTTQSGHLIVSKCVRTIFLHTYQLDSFFLSFPNTTFFFPSFLRSSTSSNPK